MLYRLSNKSICIYLEDSPDLPLHTDFGDGETYAKEVIKHVINHEVLGKGKEKVKCKHRYSASHHGD